MEEFRNVGADVSGFQSQMHSEYDSAESIADSDLEDGELRKMLASPLYLQNREHYESSRMPIATGKLVALFSFGNEEAGDQFKSSVFRIADPSNVGRSLLEGNKDHLLSQPKSELMRQEHQVDLSIIVSVSYSNMLVLNDWIWRTPITDILNLENKFDYKKN